MCNSQRYCKYCLTRLRDIAGARGNLERASQLQTSINERVFARQAPAITKTLNINDYHTVAIDCDDTIGSFEEDMRQALAIRDGLTFSQALDLYPPLPQDGMDDWWISEPNYREYSHGQYLDLEAKGLLYHSQPVRENAGKVINKIAKHTRVIFLTARPKETNHLTQTWLKEKVKINFTPVVVNSHAKHEVEGFDLLIDDAINQIQKVSEQRETIFMSRPRTTGKVQGRNISEAFNWGQVEEILAL